MQPLLELTEATFDEVVRGSPVPVLVTFTARWCSACKAFAPVLEQFADEEDGRLVVAKIDVDDHRRIADRYGVMAMPTSVLFVDGNVRRHVVGGRTRSRLVDELADSLAVR
jgi:thioredoxin 1